MSVIASGTHWSFDREGPVGIWTIHDWEALFETEIDQAERHYSETASEPEITGAVVAFESVDSLGTEMQSHMTDAWSSLAQAVDLDRTAYVADGITGMAVRSNVEAPDTELRAFESLDDAVSWAGGEA